MGDLIKHKSQILYKWFISFYECPRKYVCRDRLAWVEIRHIPIHAWNDRFFTSAGNCLGIYVGLNKNSASIERLDFANIMIEVDESAVIPKSLIVDDGDEEFRVSIFFIKWADHFDWDEIQAVLCPIVDGAGEFNDVNPCPDACNEVNRVATLEANMTSIKSPGIPNDIPINEYELIMSASKDDYVETRMVSLADVDSFNHMDSSFTHFRSKPKIFISSGPEDDGGLKLALVDSVPETQLGCMDIEEFNEGNHQSTSKIFSEAANSEMERSEKERRVVIYNNDLGVPAPSLNDSTMELIRKEVRQIIEEGRELGLNFSLNGEALEN